MYSYLGAFINFEIILHSFKWPHKVQNNKKWGQYWYFTIHPARNVIKNRRDDFHGVTLDKPAEITVATQISLSAACTPDLKIAMS